MKPVFVRSPYNYDVDKASVESGLQCADVSRAQQHFEAECNINTIVDRFGIGYEPPAGVRLPEYGDFTGIGTYHQALEAVRAADVSFNALPAAARAEFGNDPGRFVDFVESAPDARQKLAAWGMLKADAAVAQAGPGGSVPQAGVTPSPAPAAAPAPSGAS